MVRLFATLGRFVVLGAIFALLAFSQALAFNSWTEGFVGTGSQTLDIYFVVGGNSSQKFLVYGLGPTLKNFGVTNPVKDPKILLWRLASDGTIQEEVGRNNNWEKHASADAVAEALKSFNSTIKEREAAMVVSLAPGVYKLGVRVAGGPSGRGGAGAVTWNGGTGGGGSGAITPGVWDGGTANYGVCLNVASDGSKLTSRGSLCKDGDAFRIDFDSGLNGDCGDNDGYMNISGDINIINNKFTRNLRNVTGGWGPTIDLKITGTFSGDRVSGTFTKTIFGGECTGLWEASPAP